jgi:hypothetical protein
MSDRMKTYLERVTPCGECAGTGEQPGKTWRFACRACYGTGKTRERFTPDYAGTLVRGEWLGSRYWILNMDRDIDASAGSRFVLIPEAALSSVEAVT